MACLFAVDVRLLGRLLEETLVVIGRLVFLRGEIHGLFLSGARGQRRADTGIMAGCRWTRFGRFGRFGRFRRLPVLRYAVLRFAVFRVA
jgi:hypothetical protein